MDKRNKTLVMVVTVVVAIAIIAMLGIWYVSSSTTDGYRQSIDEAVENFESDDRQAKVDAYHQLEEVANNFDNETGYLKSNNDMTEIGKVIYENLSTMMSYFANEYAQIFSENSLFNLQEIEDVEVLQGAIANLEDLQTLIEEDDVLGQAEANNYKNLIIEKVTSYEKRLTELGVEMEENEEEPSDEVSETSTESQVTEQENNAPNQNNDTSNDTSNEVNNDGWFNLGRKETTQSSTSKEEPSSSQQEQTSSEEETTTETTNETSQETEETTSEETSSKESSSETSEGETTSEESSTE